MIKNQFDRTWSLFLDRDGVINRQIKGDYVRSFDQFEWLPGSLETIVSGAAVFGRIFIVTNQQGIGKGLMTITDLEDIHRQLVDTVSRAGGRIDKVYYSPYLAAEQHPFRKPEIGMALQAKMDFPEVDFEKSIMVGDSASDILFGKKAGMKTVLIHEKPELSPHYGEDWAIKDLASFLHL